MLLLTGSIIGIVIFGRFLYTYNYSYNPILDSLNELIRNSTGREKLRICLEFRRLIITYTQEVESFSNDIIPLPESIPTHLEIIDKYHKDFKNIRDDIEKFVDVSEIYEILEYNEQSLSKNNKLLKLINI